MRVDSPESSNRILTIPNVITIVRLACLPVFLWLLFGRDDWLAAAALLAVLGITDFVDGYIARHLHQVSDLGKVLDPTADRLLFIVGVGGIMVVGAAPLWFSILVLAREIAVGSGHGRPHADGHEALRRVLVGQGGDAVPHGVVPVLPGQ